jgi:hypothetical protein
VGDKGTTARYRRSKTQEFGLTLPSPIVSDVIGRTNPRRSQQCMATGDVFVASTGKNCCGGVEGCWNVALRTPMKRGGVRRVHLRGRKNILKRALIQVGGFNLSLVIRQLVGKGTPRSLQGLSAGVPLILLRFWIAASVHTEPECTSVTMPVPLLAVHMVVLIPLAAE